MSISIGSVDLANPHQVIVDRCVHPRIAKALTGFGMTCNTIAEVFGDERAQSLQDVELFEYAAKHGYAVLTANPKMLRVPHERQSIEHNSVQVYCIANTQMTREERAFVIGRHILRIRRRMSKPGPVFWRLYLKNPLKYDIN